MTIETMNYSHQTKRSHVELATVLNKAKDDLSYRMHDKHETSKNFYKTNFEELTSKFKYIEDNVTYFVPCLTNKQKS